MNSGPKILRSYLLHCPPNLFDVRKWGGNDAPRKKNSQDQAVLTSPGTPGALDSCVTNEALSCKQKRVAGESAGWALERVLLSSIWNEYRVGPAGGPHRRKRLGLPRHRSLKKLGGAGNYSQLRANTKKQHTLHATKQSKQHIEEQGSAQDGAHKAYPIEQAILRSNKPGRTTSSITTVEIANSSARPPGANVSNNIMAMGAELSTDQRK